MDASGLRLWQAIGPLILMDYVLPPHAFKSQRTLNIYSYQPLRAKLVDLWQVTRMPAITNVISSALAQGGKNLVQFLLDPSTHPLVIRLYQEYGQEPMKIIFYLTRTWCFSIHNSRARLLGRWVS